MVARFHEGCLHRRVDGQIEEFIFTEASKEALRSWQNKIESMMASYENPKIARWLIDLRFSGPLPIERIMEATEYLQKCSGGIGKSLRIAYVTDSPEIFTTLFSSIRAIFDIEISAKWFNGNHQTDPRLDALSWLTTQTQE